MGWNPQWDPSVGSGGDATPKRPHNGPKMTPKWGQLQLVRHGVDLEPIQPVGEKRRQKPQNDPKSPQNRTPNGTRSHQWGLGGCDPKTALNDPKMGPQLRMEPAIGSRGNTTPKWPQNGPKWPHNGVTIGHRAISGVWGKRDPKKAPNLPQMTPKWGPN